MVFLWHPLYHNQDNNDLTFYKLEDIFINLRKYRGIDAPEYKMPYDDESKDELTSLVLGKQLALHVYTIDIYGRFVCDIHSHDTFIQVRMLYINNVIYLSITYIIWRI